MRRFTVILAVFLLLTWVALRGPFSIAEHDGALTADFGDPIPGLGAAELFAFEEGRAVFLRRFHTRDGLGPHFNAVACVSCHEDPAPGGSSQRYRDFYLALDESGRPIYPACTDDNLPTHDTEVCLPSGVMPHYGPVGEASRPVTASVAHPPVPGNARVALRNAPPLFGVGLFRLVSDEEILSRADPGDADGDGISGRVNRIAAEDDAIGRFGYKCQTASIEAFNRGALHNQMGLTTDSIELAGAEPPRRNALLAALLPRVAHAQVAAPRDRITDHDRVPDPEVSRFELASLIAFQENLAAPQRGRITNAVLRGESVFEEIGCTGCHTPTLPTPLGSLHAYTDLLIHDMGEELADGVVMGLATGSEFRTQPLWGVCRHPPFLHDGRAETLAEAILLHGGEASAARERYQALSPPARADLHRFLESL